MLLLIKKLVFAFFMFLLLFQDLKAQDLLVTFSGDSMNVKIESILSDRLVYKQNGGLESIASREVKDFKRDYFSAEANEDYFAASSSRPPNGKTASKQLQMHAGIHYSWSYSLAAMPDNIGKFEEEYLKNLKSGYSYGFSLGFFVEENLAIGLSVDKYRSIAEYRNVIFQAFDTSLIMDLKDDISIHFYSPTVFFRFSNASENVNFLLGLSIGYTTYKDEAHGIIVTSFNNSKYSFGESDKLIEGNRIGMGLSFSADIKVEKFLYIGPYFDFYSGVITNYTYSDKIGSVNMQNVPVDEGLSVARLSLGAKLSVYF